MTLKYYITVVQLCKCFQQTAGGILLRFVPFENKNLVGTVRYS